MGKGLDFSDLQRTATTVRRTTFTLAMIAAMSWHRITHSIVARLLLLGVTLVVLSLVARYFTLTRYLRDDITQVVAQQQLSLAQYAARDIDRAVIQRQTWLAQVAAQFPPQDVQDPAATERWLRASQRFQTLFSGGLLLVDRDGRILLNHSVLKHAGTWADMAGQPLASLVAGSTPVGAPVLNGTPDKAVLPIVAPITNAAGQPIAALVGLTYLSDADFLGNLLHSQGPSSQGGFLLISPQDKLFISSSQSNMVLKPTPPPGVNPLHDQAMAGLRGTGTTINAQGVEEISAMVSVPSTGWFVVARIPTDAALITVTRLKAFMVRNGILSFTVFTAIFLTILYWVFRPLLRATAAANRMTHGQSPLQPLPHEGHDEVGTFVAAFNRLLGKLHEQQLALAQAAHHDSLTGLPNRKLLADRLAQALAQAKRHHSAVALLFLDLDLFKPINDSLGHDAGDQVLQEVARRLQRLVRETDSVARIGGDEFVILLSEVHAPTYANVERVMQHVLQALSQPFEVAGTQCTLGASIGGVIGHGHSTAKRLLMRADQLMYRAKSQGRGGYVIEDEDDKASEETPVTPV